MCVCVCVDSLAYIGSRKAAREGSKTHATHLPLPHSHLRLSLFSSQTANGRRVKSIVSDRPAVCPRTRETRLAAAKRASETANDNYSLNFSTDSVREIPNQPNQTFATLECQAKLPPFSLSLRRNRVNYAENGFPPFQPPKKVSGCSLLLATLARSHPDTADNHTRRRWLRVQGEAKTKTRNN